MKTDENRQNATTDRRKTQKYRQTNDRQCGKQQQKWMLQEGHNEIAEMGLNDFLLIILSMQSTKYAPQGISNRIWASPCR